MSPMIPMDTDTSSEAIAEEHEGVDQSDVIEASVDRATATTSTTTSSESGGGPSTMWTPRSAAIAGGLVLAVAVIYGGD